MRRALIPPLDSLPAINMHISMYLALSKLSSQTMRISCLSLTTPLQCGRSQQHLR